MSGAEGGRPSFCRNGTRAVGRRTQEWEREMEGGREGGEGGIWPKFKFKAGRKPDGTGNMAFCHARCF